jgi:hypothetical protein
MMKIEAIALRETTGADAIREAAIMRSLANQICSRRNTYQNSLKSAALIAVVTSAVQLPAASRRRIKTDAGDKASARTVGSDRTFLQHYARCQALIEAYKPTVLSAADTASAVVSAPRIITTARAGMRTSQGTVHSTQEPANAERNKNRRVRLGFDRVAQGTFKRRSGSSGGGHGVIRDLRRSVPCLTIEVLCGALDLVRDSFNLGLGVADDAAKSFLCLSA